MYRFIRHILLYAVIVVGINSIVTSLMPEWWENPELRRKSRYFHSLDTVPNTLMYGSSRTLRHLDPIIFDSLNALNGLKTTSFSFANSGTFVNEQLYIIGTTLSRYPKTAHVKYILTELDDLVYLPQLVRNTTHGSYYVNLDNLPKFINAVIHEDDTFTSRGHHIIFYLKALFRNYLNFGQGRELIDALYIGNGYLPSGFRNGYIPVDTSLDEYSRSVYCQLRHRRLLNDPGRIHDDFVARASINANSRNDSAFNPIVLSWYLDLIQKMNRRSCTVICCIPIRGTIKPELLSLFYALPEKNRMNMTDYPGIETLDDPTLWFDAGHLNLAGSRIYSRLFAKAFQEHVAVFFPPD